jgi:D-glycero-alpha-D-manno-heptose 1-phosphate guanylyltransferase
MKAIILAGGLGLRLRKIIQDVPKPMAPINGKPFLEYLILYLKGQGVSEVILATGHKSSVIKKYFGSGKRIGMKIRYSYETKPLGTAGAIKKALALIRDESFVVLNGDSYADVNLGRLLKYHFQKKSAITMALVEIDNVSRYGSVRIDRKGKVLKFDEKKNGGRGFVNAGVYVINRNACRCIGRGSVSLEKDILPFMAESGLYGMPVKSFFIDMGLPKDYLSLTVCPDKFFKSVFKTKRKVL